LGVQVSTDNRNGIHTAVDRELLITLEILAAVSMLLILLVQRPGIPTEKYALRHNQVDFQRRRSEVAVATERDFAESHPIAKIILFRAGGILLFVAGLSVILVSAPLTFDPKWIVKVLIGLGLAIQLVSVVLWDFWGLALARRISRNVRSQVPVEGQGGDPWS
jgi:hypothetical protein